MIPLGWTSETVTLPTGFFGVSANGLSVLSVRGQQTARPKDKLAAQVRLFEAGVDFLPVPPRAELSMEAALRLAQAERGVLLRAVGRVESRGQMVLAISWQEGRTQHAPSASGRTWLKTRHGDLRRTERLADDARYLVGTLVEATGFPTAPIETRRGAVQTCLLVPRRHVNTFMSTIASHARTLPTSSLTLTLTGPWPPSAFVPRFETDQGIAA